MCILQKNKGCFLKIDFFILLLFLSFVHIPDFRDVLALAVGAVHWVISVTAVALLTLVQAPGGKGVVKLGTEIRIKEIKEGLGAFSCIYLFIMTQHKTDQRKKFPKWCLPRKVLKLKFYIFSGMCLASCLITSLTLLPLIEVKGTLSCNIDDINQGLTEDGGGGSETTIEKEG